MILIQRLNGDLIRLGLEDSICCRLCRLNGCDVRDVVVHGIAPDLVAVLDGLLRSGRIDDQLHLAPFHEVKDIGTAVEDLIYPLNGDPRFIADTLQYCLWR